MEKSYKSVIENRFKAFDNMLEGITVYKLIFDDEGEAIDGIIEYMNPVTVGTMDINPEDVIGKNAMDLFGSDFLKPYFEAINEFLTKGEFKSFEVYYPPTDKYFLVSGFDMPDNLFVILRTDITDRKKAEKALIKSEENYRSIIENLQDGFFRLDKEGKIIMASPSAASIYGFGSVPEMIGITAIHLYKNVEDRKYLMAELNKHGKLNDYEVEAVKRDGTFIWISLNAQFYYDDEGQIQGIDGFVRDITERKQAEMKNRELLEEVQQFAEELEVSNEELQCTTEELQVTNEELRQQGEELLQINNALHEGEEKFSSAFHANPAIMTLSDAEGRLIDVNDSFLKLTGCGRDEVIGYTSAELNLIDAGKREQYSTELQEKGSMHDVEFEMRTKFGEKRIITLGSETIRHGSEIRFINFIYDITERKMANEVLHTTLQRFYTIISSMHAAVLLVAEDNMIEFANQAFCDYFSLTESPEDLVGITDSEMLKKIKNVYQNPEEAISHIRKIVSRSKPVIGEEVSMQGGRTCLRDFVPIYIEEKPYGRLWLHYDITKRKQLEMKQHQLARQRQLALDAANMGWWHYDPVTDISTYDEQYKKIFGVSGSQRPNEEILNILHPNDLPNVWAKVEAALDPADPQPYFAEYRIFHDDGSVRWIEAHGIATFEGEGDDRIATSLVGTVEDITERKEAGEKLKESEEKFFKIFHSSPVGTVLTNEEGKFIEANESYLGLTGYSKAELIGHSAAELNIMDAENRDSIMNETYEKGKIQDLEVEIQTKSGGKCTVLTTLEPIIISGKSRNLGFVYDITKRKKAEERINKLLEESQKLNEELQVSNEELQSTTEELQVANEELQDTTEELQVANEELRQQGDELIYVNKSLRESEIRLSRSQEIAHLGSWELDLVNNQLYWSDEVYRIFGLQPQEFGATYEAFLEAIHPDDREAVDDAYTGSLREGRDSYEIEHRVVRKSTGEIRIVHEKCEHFRDESGQIIRSVGMVHDITERKKAEQEREVTVELLRLVNESTGIQDLVQSAVTFFKKQSACNAVGIRLQDGCDYPYFEARGFPEEFVLMENLLCEYDDNEPVCDSRINSILDCMCGNVICGRFDPSKPFFTSKGSFWTNNTTELLASTSGEDRQARTRNRCNGEGYESVALIPLQIGEHILGLLQLNDKRKDIFSSETIALWERMADYIAIALAKFQAEEALKEAHDNLEQKVDERTVEIEEAYQLVKENEVKLKDTVLELERSNEELQSFAYITSHDLQEPLRSVASYAQLIQRRYGGQLDSDADEFIDFMVSGATRMKGMIQGLLDYSRVNRAGIEFVKTDMNAKVEKAVSNLQYAIDKSSAEITHDNLPNVIADPDQMVRAFQNLIGNAIKFKKDDEPSRIHISAGTDKETNEWVFSVSDNGIGMEKQYTHKIFEVFKRLHTIDAYEGTGIGLAIVKRIIDRHGGRVWVESSLGKGSTFYFTIPMVNK